MTAGERGVEEHLSDKEVRAALLRELDAARSALLSSTTTTEPSRSTEAHSSDTCETTRQTLSQVLADLAHPHARMRGSDKG